MKPIAIRNLCFSYRNSSDKALNNINLDICGGEFVALMGRSGAGKSTLCRCLNGIIPNFQKGDLNGDIQIFGESIKGKKIFEIAQNVGLVFQDFESQLFSTNVELEVAFCPENLAIPREEIANRVKSALQIVGLSGFEKRQPYTLSGGEKQRLAIASVISGNPRILILDEPTTDLDPKGRYDVLRTIRSLVNENMSLLIVEHEVEDILDSDRVIILDKGEIVVSGKTSDVITNVQLLENHGIRPPQLAKLFKEVFKLDEIPFTAESAYEICKQRIDTLINEDMYKKRLSMDEQKKKTYKEVMISVKGLRYSYPESEEVLTRIDLEIRQGEFVAIIGQNGSGKTTLAKHFNGLLKPTEGKVYCSGKDTRKMSISELGKIVGFVFQNPDHQIFASSVREELSFGPKNFNFSSQEISENISQALKAVHLEGYEDFDPFMLTKGERQRVAVASILACKPKVLILDEPTTGLDYTQQKSMMELLRSLNNNGHTIIIITHSLWIVAEYAHRVIVMHKGNIAMDGQVRDVFSRQSELDSIGIKLPELIKFGNMIGKTLLSVNEFIDCMNK